ncbi:MAG: hypothetical protein WC599_07885, partial [Bacteroidales bacterium]
MRKISYHIIFLIICFFCKDNFLYSQPTTIPGLILWLAADSVHFSFGSSIDTIYDLSGNGNHAVQTNTSFQPILLNSIPQLNYHSVIQFDGTDDYLQLNTSINNIRSVFLVLKKKNGSTPNARPLLGHTTYYDFLSDDGIKFWGANTSNNILQGETRLNSQIINGTQVDIPTVYSIISIITTGNVRADNISKDRSYSDRVWDGDYAEIIICDLPLSDTERQTVENYLQCKYRLTLFTTTAITSITNHSAISGGNIICDGGVSIIKRGVCWNTLQNPTIINSHTNDGTGIGTFVSSITGLDSSTTYYVRAYTITNIDTTYGDEKYFTTLPTPFDTTNLTLWLKADLGVTKDINNLVSKWDDQSVHINNATQSTNIASQPLWVDNQLNTKPVVRFDGINDFMEFPEISTIRTVFFVVKNTDVVGKCEPLLGHDVNYQWLDGCGITGTSLFGENTSALITNGYGYNNGVYYNPVGTTNFLKPIDYSIFVFVLTGNGTSKYITNDRNMTGRYWTGDYAEIIIYDTVLTTTQRQQVEQYLRFKYAPLPVNLGPDIYSTNFCDTTLDAGPHFIHYKWNTGNTADTLSTLTVNTGGIYSVTATDVFGFTSVDTVIVNKPTIAVHDTLSCFGSSVTLITGLGAPYTFLWLPGNDTSSSINVIAPDIVTLTVYDTSGCNVTRQIIITADSFPVQASLGNITNVCTGNEIGLAVGANEAVTYLWSDSGTDSLFTVTWTSGAHDISVTVTNSMGCIATDTVTVYVQGQEPVAAFSSTS